ncbi:hypothetical protein F4805DRAFT_434791 [Annulohypoxylon moriforme]|nr:hypothetical protein F4805DRAFT_434791 [Annulohypoxylon moriforme]
MLLHRNIYSLTTLLAQVTLYNVVSSCVNDLAGLRKEFPTNPNCRFLPDDNGWPSSKVWSQLNETVGGRLLTGVPLGKPCYEADYSPETCAELRDNWTGLTPFLNDPVNVIASFWQNNSCNPFFGQNGRCVLGNMASYAINVSSGGDVVAGIEFAEANNIRLTIKSTGHDYLGRASGHGSLALWTHNLKGINFLNYSSPGYTGPAARVGAGVESSELLAAASARGYRAVAGECATVSVAGGFTQGGGHSTLGATYGMAADQVLEWEVVTATGQHLTVSSTTENSDLFWALSGGGAANYAVVISMTVKIYPDGPVAGGTFSFVNTDEMAFWAAVSAWINHTLFLDKIPSFNTGWSMTAQGFQLVYAMLPDGTAEDVTNALEPVITQIKALNVSFATNTVMVSPNYKESYDTFLTQAYSTNNTLASRLIPRSLVQNNLSALVDVMRAMTKSDMPYLINGIAGNVAHQSVGNSPTSNAVLPAWRDSVYHMSFGVGWPATAGWDVLSAGQKLLNEWQAMLREITPGGGTYMNEATYDNPTWKEDYFGDNYGKLLRIKRKYDPNNLFWANAAVGSDESWKVEADGRLCRL